jgi:hypothetical protein
MSTKTVPYWFAQSVLMSGILLKLQK